MAVTRSNISKRHDETVYKQKKNKIKSSDDDDEAKES